jgi:hypothetical protein
MSVNELTQKADLKAKVEYIGREVEQLAAVVTPAVDDIKEKLSALKSQMHEFLTPEIARENQALKLSLNEARQELNQCLKDLQHFAGAHASEYASRRYAELVKTLSR